MKVVPVILVGWNKQDYSEQCLESIYKHTDVPFHVVAVDNGSTDETTKVFEKFKDRKEGTLTALRSDKNLGFGGGHNLGMQYALDNIDFDHLLIINNDTVVTPKYLSRMLNCLNGADKHFRKKGFGVVGPVSNYASGVQQVNAPEFENFEDMNEYSDKYFEENKEKWLETERLIGFCMLFKKEVLEEVGLFDDRFFPGMWEDNDICLRIRGAGHLMAVATDTFIYHYGSKSLAATDSSKVFYDNQKRYLDKWNKINKIGEKKKLVGIMRVKNGVPWVSRALEACSRMCDEIVVLDDHSTDKTPEICKSFEKVHYIKSPFDHFDEARDRNFVVQEAKKLDPDWIYCLAGETKIPLVDGTTKTIKDLSELSNWDNVWVYSVDEKGKIVPGKVNKVWKTGTRKTLRVTLDNDESFRCTPEHLVMLRDGSYVEAKDLKEDMSLMPLYKKLSEKGLPGYEMVYSPGENKWHYSHREFWKVSNSLEQNVDNKGFVIHHKNFNPRDNSPNNLVKMSREAHGKLHSQNRTPEHVEKLKKACGSIENRLKQSRLAKERLSNVPYEERLERTEPGRKACLTPEVRKRKSESLKAYWKSDKAEKQRHAIKESTEKPEWKQKQAKGLRDWARSKTAEEREVINQNISNAKKLNHKVIKVEEVGIYEDVYDMEVDEFHNFSIGFEDGSGTVVHNCFDHDEVPEEKLIRNIQGVLNHDNPEIRGFIFKICHFWNTPKTIREDGLWGGFWQVRLFRNEKNQVIVGDDEGLHSGSTPFISPMAMSYTTFRIKHYGNMDPKVREGKYKYYTTLDKNKDLGAILGGWAPYYHELYYGKGKGINEKVGV